LRDTFLLVYTFSDRPSLVSWSTVYSRTRGCCVHEDPLKTAMQINMIPESH